MRVSQLFGTDNMPVDARGFRNRESFKTAIFFHSRRVVSYATCAAPVDPGRGAIVAIMTSVPLSARMPCSSAGE